MQTLIYITTTPKATLNFNVTKGFFEVWQDGRRIFEILTTDKKSAVKMFLELMS